jgi:pimeloyl-ACP methyl ester carboxylesterase
MDRADRFVTVDGLELHYSDWGPPDAPVVCCVHGLSRVGRDFDPLARHLAGEYRVLAVDCPGRGLSEWADDPDAYGYPELRRRLAGFLDALDVDTLRFVGTSMGGALGVALADGALRDRITHLVVNDVSPTPSDDAEVAALERIGEYVGDPSAFDTVSDLEAHYRDLYEGRFGAMTDVEWRRFTLTSCRRRDDGRVAPAHDPDVVDAALAETDDDLDPWRAWADAPADCMVLRGRTSSILTPDVFERMQERRPTATTLTVDCGHAPSVNSERELSAIATFLADDA